MMTGKKQLIEKQLSKEKNIKYNFIETFDKRILVRLMTKKKE